MREVEQRTSQAEKQLDSTGECMPRICRRDYVVSTFLAKSPWYVVVIPCIMCNGSEHTQVRREFCFAFRLQAEACYKRVGIKGNGECAITPAAGGAFALHSLGRTDTLPESGTLYHNRQSQADSRLAP